MFFRLSLEQVPCRCAIHYSISPKHRRQLVASHHPPRTVLVERLKPQQREAPWNGTTGTSQFSDPVLKHGANTNTV